MGKLLGFVGIDDSRVDFGKFSMVKKMLPELALASTVINILTLALPVILLQIYDRIIPHHSVSTLGLLTAGVVTAMALELLVRIGRNYMTGWIAASFEHTLSCDAFRRLLATPLPDFEKDGASVHLERLRATGRAREFYSGQALLALFDLPFAILYIVLIGMLGGWLVVVPCLLIVIFSAIAVWNGRIVRKEVRKQTEFDERRFSFLNETLTGIHSVKTMAMEAMMQRRYEMLQDTNVEHSHENAENSVVAVNINIVFSQIATVAVVAAGAAFVVDGQMTPGALAACVMLAGRSLRPLQAVLSTWIRFQTFAVARRQLEHLYELRSRADVQRPALPPIRGGIRLDNITLRYGKAPPLFDQLSLDIKPGECVAIQGDNGAGKSSLLALIGGQLEPTDGIASIDGNDLAQYSPSSIARAIGYLPQQGLLVEGTILENITMFDPALETAALDIAKALGLDRVVAGMRFGYDTPVGNSASDSLPAGIKQRIAIARGLVHNPAVILFDEANIAIDSGGDELLRQYLADQKGKATMILVTHRPSLVKLADRVLTIDSGRLTEDSRGDGFAGLRSAAATAAGAGQALVEVTARTQALIHRPQSEARVSTNVLGRFRVASDLALCLTALLKAHDWRGNPRQLVESLPHMAESLDISGLRRIMANLNFTCSSFPIRLDELDPRILPVLFLPDNGDSLVLMRWDEAKGTYLAFNGQTVQTESVAPGKINGEAHVFRPVEKDAEGPELGSWTKRVFSRFGPMVTMAMILTLATNLLILVPPMFVMTIFNRVLPSGDLDLIPYLVAGMCAALGVDWALRSLRGRVLAYIGGRAEFIIGNAIFERILALPAAATEQITVGSQMSRIKDLESLREMFIGAISLVFYELPATVIFVIALGIIEPWILAVLGASVSLYAILGLTSQPGMESRTNKSSRTSSTRQEFLTDALTKMRAIRCAGAEERWYERFRLMSGKAVAAEFRAQQYGAVVASLSQMLGQLTGLSAMVACVAGAFNGTTSSGAVVAVMMIIWRLVTPLQTCFLSLATLYRAASSVKQIDNLMRLRIERDEAPARYATRNFLGEVQFSRVSFRYSNDADPALLGVSVKIEPNRIVAVAGPNGAGKSTLLKLVTGLYHPQAGSVRIDNVDIRQLDPADLRALVAYAPQRCDVFYGTIAQNMRLAHPTASEDELKWAAEMAGLYDDIMAMKDGFSTRIFDGQGEQLPNGFRQRLSLARAYLKPAPIMLFDEPGNGLDNEGDNYFLAAIERLRKSTTILLVSHRPSHLRVADAIVYMEEGYVRDVGTFEQLKTVIMGNLR